MTPAQHWRDTLRRGLMSARKARGTPRVVALRSALSAIDNAEAPQVAAVAAYSAGPFAASVPGLGATEVARLELSDAEIRRLIESEVDERLSAADEFVAAGYHVRAAELRSQAAVLVQALRNV
ncbi:hypothetical protein [Mycolicibacterium brisbanense]|nr:hypothetical protein [Mycolicibacterium brisbanense]MCV7155932.1 glutamyl-tRNA amidotransferase [Mycolicibacterium brisbanense]